MMKSIQLILLLAFILFSSFTFSQSYVGVFIGMNSSKLTGDAPANSFYNSFMGINAGVNIDLKLAKSLKLSLQPSYSQEGTKISYNVSGQEEPVDSIKIRLNYFSFPILLKVATANNRFYAIGGFETGFLLNSFISSHDVKEDIKVDVKSYNLAIHFGVGLRIPIGFPNLYVEGRYAQGIINLTDEPLDTDIIPRVKTNGFKLLVGIEFPLQKSNK
ncbi:MAG: hypothetical protein DRI54_05970 [Bacteroidetes bacterium]|nr:MAG: hypothetical protein DRI54_05970 [Bacteroidota bacterium]